MNHDVEYLLSQSIYEQLCTLFESRNDGNLLDSDPMTMEAQIRFFQYVVQRAQPTKILETGTNMGCFSYVLSFLGIVHDIDIYTFDFNEQSEYCAALLNRAQQNVRIHFTQGDTKQTLAAFHEPGIGFAWIDGGHDYDTAYSDIIQAIRLGIPYIAVDDIKFPTLTHLKDVIHRILQEHPGYQLGDNPYFDQDARGAVLLERR